MTTVHQYFETDLRAPIRLEGQWAIGDGQDNYPFETATILDFNGYSKYMALFLPKKSCRIDIIQLILRNIESFFEKANNVVIGRMPKAGVRCEVKNLNSNTIRMTFHGVGYQNQIDICDLVFTGRVFIYGEENLDASDIVTLRTIFENEQGMKLEYRGPAYLQDAARVETPLAFVSHDSRDKSDIVRPLATRLRAMGCMVWYDEFSLKVGQNLKDSIMEGLKSCPKCIFVLTPNFLAKGGWPKREYDAVFTREIVEEKELILPIWAGVTSNEIYEYCPVLANRIALNWELGEEKVCAELFNALNPID